METNTLAKGYDEEDRDKNDIARVVRQSVDSAIEANRSVVMRQMEVLSMQADETQVLLQSGNLSDEQFDKALEESEKIRQAMSNTTMNLHMSNFELVVGACAVLLVGGLFIGLRAA